MHAAWSVSVIRNGRREKNKKKKKSPNNESANILTLNIYIDIFIYMKIQGLGHEKIVS